MAQHQSTRILRSVCAAFFSFVLAVSLLPFTAFATSSDAMPAADGMTGTFDGDNGVWELTAGGKLTIKPASGKSSCTMKATDSAGTILPSSVQRNNVKSIVVEGKVYIEDSAATTFKDMAALESAQLANLDTSRLTTMKDMFRGCRAIAKLDLSKFNTVNVKDMDNMFMDCQLLLDLDLSSFDNVTGTQDGGPRYAMASGNMFQNCESLRMIKVGSKFSLTDKASGQPNALPGTEWFSASLGRAITTAQVVGGTRDYADSLYKTPVDINYVTISPVTEKFTYTGNPIQPEPKVSLDGVHYLQSGEQFSYQYQGDKTAVGGVHNVFVEPMGPDFAGKLKAEKYVSYQIEQADIADAKVEVLTKTYNCDGKEKRPEVRVTLGSRELRSSADYWVKYGNNIEPGTAAVTVYGQGNYKGVAKQTGSFTITGTMPADSTYKETLHRVYNPNSGEHFFTASDAEKDNLVKAGWRYEGTAWTAPKSNSSKTPVYRLYNANAGDHHYTLDSNERDDLVFKGWKYEGIGWYSDDDKGVSIYRLYNPNAKAGAHHYTTSKGENDSLVKVGWRAEGIGWYGIKTS